MRFFQVNVSMEYSRKMGAGDGTNPVADSRVMDFGSIFVPSLKKEGADVPPASSIDSNRPSGANVAEIIVARGFGTVIRHRDFEERSSYYDALLSAESRAINGKKGMHSLKESAATHITDLTGVRYLIISFL